MTIGRSSLRSWDGARRVLAMLGKEGGREGGIGISNISVLSHLRPISRIRGHKYGLAFPLLSPMFLDMRNKRSIERIHIHIRLNKRKTKQARNKNMVTRTLAAYSAYGTVPVFITIET